jgi:hypothetical protein
MWSPKGKRKRDRPKETLGRTIERKAKTIGPKTQDLQNLATNKKKRKTMTSALCAKLAPEEYDDDVSRNVMNPFKTSSNLKPL